MNDFKYGSLLNRDAKLHRKWFEEMVNLLGVQVIYRAPKLSSKEYDLHGDLHSKYDEPMVIGCMFEEHPDQKTLKKMGWVSELQEEASIIHVPYGLPGLQQGALFIIPSGLDYTEGRVFRLV